jgi:hypothetical protein
LTAFWPACGIVIFLFAKKFCFGEQKKGGNTGDFFSGKPSLIFEKNFRPMRGTGKEKDDYRKSLKDLIFKI